MAKKDEDFDHNADRYPRIRHALSAVQDKLPNEALYVERIEFVCMANGEVNCRWWTPRAEEPDGIFLPSE